MKRISSILLLITILILALFCTSCESKELPTLNSYEDIILFIYGEGDAANYFINHEFFGGTSSALHGMVKTFDNIVNVITQTWNNITGASIWSTIGNFLANNWVVLLLVWLGLSLVLTVISPHLFAIVSFLPVWIVLGTALICIVVAVPTLIVSIAILLISALFLFISFIADVVITICIFLSMIVFGLLRFLTYILIDLGWGEEILKNFSDYKDYIV